MTNVKQNRAAWNRLAETGSQFASVATDEELQNPLQTLETRGWLPPEVTGLNVLCLAGGGWLAIDSLRRRWRKRFRCGSQSVDAGPRSA